MIDFARPRDVGHVDHAVESLFQFDEGAVTGEIANLALDVSAGRVFLHRLVPRIGFKLADAQRDFLFFTVDAEHDGFHFLIQLEHIGGFGNALGPGKFRDVNQALDAGFEFDERAIGNEVDDPAFDASGDGVFGFDLVPRVGEFLFEAETDALFLEVDVKDDDVDILAYLQNIRRVADASPTHVRDVQEAVDAIEVDEGAEVGDVLDGALADVTGRHFAKNFGALVAPFLFDEFATGENDVLAFLIDLDDFESVTVPDEDVQVARRADVDLRGGQEGFHADVDDQTAFDDGFDFAGDGPAFVTNGENVVPILFELGFFLGKNHHAVLVLEFFDQDINLIAHLDGLDVLKFIGGDDTLAFVADVHEDFLGTDFDDGTFDDFASDKAHGALLHGFFHGEHNDSAITTAGGLVIPTKGIPKTPLPNRASLTTVTVEAGGPDVAGQRRLRARLLVNFFFSASMNCHTRGVQARVRIGGTAGDARVFLEVVQFENDALFRYFDMNGVIRWWRIEVFRVITSLRERWKNRRFASTSNVSRVIFWNIGLKKNRRRKENESDGLDGYFASLRRRARSRFLISAHNNSSADQPHSWAY